MLTRFLFETLVGIDINPEHWCTMNALLYIFSLLHGQQVYADLLKLFDNSQDDCQFHIDDKELAIPVSVEGKTGIPSDPNNILLRIWVLFSLERILT